MNLRQSTAPQANEKRRNELLDDAPEQFKRTCGAAQQANEKRRNELLDDAPEQFKRTPGAASNALLCEAFAAERLEAYQAKVSARGKGELNIAKTIRESPDPAKLVKKLQAALEKERSTWTKCEAVSTVTPKEAVGIAENLIIDARGVWTNKGQDPETRFEPKCRIEGKGLKERYKENQP